MEFQGKERDGSDAGGSDETLKETPAETNNDSSDCPGAARVSFDLDLQETGNNTRPDVESDLTASESSAEYGSSNFNSLLSQKSITELNEGLPDDVSIGSKGDSLPASNPTSADNSPRPFQFDEVPSIGRAALWSEGSEQDFEVLISDLSSEDLPIEDFVVCDSQCFNHDCQQLLENLRHISQECDNSKCQMCEAVCQYIRQHVDNECPETCCPVPFCTFLSDNDSSEGEAVSVKCRSLWKERLEIIRTSRDVKFRQLDDASPDTALHCDFVCNLGSVGHFSTVLVKSHGQFSIVKKYVSQDTEASVRILENLRSCQCPNIAKHYWVASYGKCIYSSSQFELGGFLEEYLDYLTAPQIWHCLRQFINAASFLHERNIIYLLWTCGNVLLNFDRASSGQLLVRLCNFSSAVSGSHCWSEDAIEDIYMSVQPACIIPPELKEDGPCLQSDVWGLGCITYELTHKYRVHPELRHHLPEGVRKQICLQPLPILDDGISGAFTEFMRHCFQVNAQERWSLERLYEAIR